jgi:predicted transglutaminase-like cysteine proteinase
LIRYLCQSFSRFSATLLCGALISTSHCGDAAPGAGTTGRLHLPVAEVVERHPPYADFCRRTPRECDLRGATVLPLNPALLDSLSTINLAVNNEIEFALDIEQYNVEEHWALPDSGRGDCEDMALEKRSRLVRSGLAPGALRLALVFHRILLSSHCVLTVETSGGTYLLDSFTSEVLRWDRTPYNFEARERPDGLWDRFDQTRWRYGP